MPARDATDVLAALRVEWRWLGRTPDARRALAHLRDREGAVVPPTVADLVELVVALEPNGGLTPIERARVVAALLASAEDRMLRRCLLQTLLPGIVSVARVLSFGAGVADDPRTFLADALAEASELLEDWAGQHRPYAAPDLLGALRCRLRRRMLAEKARRAELIALPERADVRDVDAEAFVRELAHAVTRGVTDVDLVYARCVLGVPSVELADARGVTVGVLRRRLAHAARAYGASRS